MTHLYILTDPDKIRVNLYKIGIHTGTADDLIGRYQTYLPIVKIILFEAVPNARDIETAVKNKFADQRQQNNNERLSEWYECNIRDIMSFVIGKINTQPDVPLLTEAYRSLSIISENDKRIKQLERTIARLKRHNKAAANKSRSSEEDYSDDPSSDDCSSDDCSSDDCSSDYLDEIPETYVRKRSNRSSKRPVKESADDFDKMPEPEVRKRSIGSSESTTVAFIDGLFVNGDITMPSAIIHWDLYDDRPFVIGANLYKLYVSWFELHHPNTKVVGPIIFSREIKSQCVHLGHASKMTSIIGMGAKAGYFIEPSAFDYCRVEMVEDEFTGERLIQPLKQLHAQKLIDRRSEKSLYQWHSECFKDEVIPQKYIDRVSGDNRPFITTESMYELYKCWVCTYTKDVIPISVNSFCRDLESPQGIEYCEDKQSIEGKLVNGYFIKEDLYDIILINIHRPNIHDEILFLRTYWDRLCKVATPPQNLKNDMSPPKKSPPITVTLDD
jgi:hypothetical protein